MKTFLSTMKFFNCLHVFAEIKYPPRMNSSLSKKIEMKFHAGVKKKKKNTCKHFVPGWNLTKNMFLLNFLRMYLMCFPTLTCLNLMKDRKIYYKAFLLKAKPWQWLSFIFFVKFTKDWNFSLFLHLSLLYVSIFN